MCLNGGSSSLEFDHIDYIFCWPVRMYTRLWGAHDSRFSTTSWRFVESDSNCLFVYESVQGFVVAAVMLDHLFSLCVSVFFVNGWLRFLVKQAVVLHRKPIMCSSGKKWIGLFGAGIFKVC